MTNQVAKQLSKGGKCIKIQPKLCEDYYLVYTIEDGALCCYLLDGDGMNGDRADALTNGQLYTFVDVLLQRVEGAHWRNGNYAKSREVARVREDIYQALKCN